MEDLLKKPRFISWEDDSPSKICPKTVKETFFAIKSRCVDGTAKLNEYKVLKTLGKGSYSKVKLAINEKTSKKLAIKFFSQEYFKASKQIYKEFSRRT